MDVERATQQMHHPATCMHCVTGHLRQILDCLLEPSVCQHTQHMVMVGCAAVVQLLQHSTVGVMSRSHRGMTPNLKCQMRYTRLSVLQVGVMRSHDPELSKRCDRQMTPFASWYRDGQMQCVNILQMGVIPSDDPELSERFCQLRILYRWGEFSSVNLGLGAHPQAASVWHARSCAGNFLHVPRQPCHDISSGTS